MDLSKLSIKEREELLQLLELKAKEHAQDDLAEYCRQVLEFEPAKHHLLMIEGLEQIERGELDILLIQLPPGSAKALALDTPIPTPDGWKNMGDLKVGDKIFGDDGNPCNVTWVSPVWKDRPVYKVNTDCGDTIIADMDHEWRVCTDRKPKVPKFKLMKTKEMAKKFSKRPLIERAKPLNLPDVELPIDPYLLGMWLGNGDSNSVAMTTGLQDIEFVRCEIERLGYKTSSRSNPMHYGVLGIRDRFVKFGLINDVHHNTFGRKHIPEIYMRASESQRLSLLQGLIDSDGTVCKERGMVTFTNTNKELALQTLELVRTLGRKASFSSGRAMLYEKDCGEFYRVIFYHKNAARLPRKLELCRDQYRTPNTYIDVEECGIADTVCIEVDSPTHLFLAGKSMTPTHNSLYGSVAFPSWYIGRNPKKCIIAASHTAELAERFGRRVRNTVTGNVHKSIFPKFALSESSQAAGRWETAEGGEYFAVGVEGAITGRRADCLPYWTDIKTPSGSKKISKVIPGDYVWSYGMNGQQWGKVIATSCREEYKIFRIKLEDGRFLEATLNHRIYTLDGFKTAGKVTRKDTLIDANKNYVKVKDIEICEYEKPVLVYDLQVQDTECFYANDILVHNCAIIDDPVRSREDADSSIVRDKQWAWWRDDLMTRMKPGGAIVLIMTRWHESDLAGRILKDYENTTKRIRVIKIPMIAGDDDPLGRLPGEQLWPEWFTPAMLEEAQKEPRTWSSLYQQEPRPVGGGEFKKEWLCYYKTQPRTNAPVIIVDPSSGKKKNKGDFTAMWVIGVGADGNRYALDVVRDRLNLKDRTDKLFELVRKWKPVAVGYEEYGLQADVEYIKLEQERNQYRFRIITLGGRISKEDRIRRLIPLFQQGMIWLPESAVRITSTGKPVDIIHQFIESEYLPFPVAANDDSLDCLARIEEPEIKSFLNKTPAVHQQERAMIRIPSFNSGGMGLLG